ncbi:tigger transposable element-derived protein 4 [Rhipicephalus microplus]|uniref:tigger transposable element-derived protein 4 n=1 Tax=Rhipicephalus microplus TaxID=6941 RepID=UPI0018871792|nr:tigger transposable element-derived protein 4-like [Rhipicephalus microplus]
MSRNRKPLTLGEKLRVIEEAEKRTGSTKASIARDLNIPESSLKTILAKKDSILLNASKFGLNRKAAKDGKYAAMEKALVEWLRQARSAAIAVDGAILKEKADMIALRCGIDDFKASNGWLDRFKKRNGVVYSRCCGESSSVSSSTVEQWTALLPELIRQYKPCDVFNADETGLFYNMQPDQTLTFKGEGCHGGKRSKERLTVLLCANEDGSEKLPALVIGKFEKPRCFKNLKRLPCQYTFNRKAWMTAAKFAAYLQQLDSRMGAKDRKILLLLDNAPCHPTDTSHLRNVKVAFLPPNCTSQLQPLDAGVIKCMKQKYRKFLVQRRLAGMERKQMATKLSVLDAMHYIASAWDAVTQETIANSFRHCGFTRSGGCFSEAAVLDDDEPEFGRLELPGSFADYVGADDDVAVCSAVSLDDIIETVRPDSAETSDEEEMDDTAEASASVPTYTDVLDYVDNIRRFACAYDEVGDLLQDVAALERKLMRRGWANSQKKITDFFKR